jgi:hypothetical protein
MQQKILEGKCKFGSSMEGEQIGVVEHYRGANTYEINGKRVLRRKDGRNHMVDPENTDMPPWMGPMYYFDGEQAHAHASVSGRFYQLPFEASNGSHPSLAVKDRVNITRRRGELRSAAASLIRQLHDLTPGPNKDPDQAHHASLHKSFADIKASIERADNGEEDPDWEEVFSVDNDSTQHHHYDSHDEHSVRSINSDVDSSRVPIHFSRTPSVHSWDQTDNPRRGMVLSQSGNEDGQLRPHLAKHRVTVLSATQPIPSSAASIASSSTAATASTKGSLKRKNAKETNKGLLDPHLQASRHRVVLDPLLSHHSYALKILQSDPSVQHAVSYGQEATLNPHLQLYQQRKHQPNRTKDFTFHALAHQTPLVLDNFNIENSIASVAEQMQEQQKQLQLQPEVPIMPPDLPFSGSGTPSRIGTANNGANNGANGPTLLKYSSDIFKKPAVEYRSAEELWKEAKVQFNASHLVPDPFSAAKAQTAASATNRVVGSAAALTNNNSNNNSKNNNITSHPSSALGMRSSAKEPVVTLGPEATQSMELTLQLLTSSRATSAHNSSNRPYGLLASLDLYSTSKTAGSPDVRAPSSGSSSLPRHMSPPRSSPLRPPHNDNNSNALDLLIPTIDHFPISAKDMLSSAEPIRQVVADFMTTHDVHCSRDLTAYSSKRRERKPLDTNRTGQTKSRYRSKVRAMSPSRDCAGDAMHGDAASVLEELAEMKGLLLDIDAATVYPALIEANMDRDIDNIVLN